MILTRMERRYGSLVILRSSSEGKPSNDDADSSMISLDDKSNSRSALSERKVDVVIRCTWKRDQLL